MAGIRPPEPTTNTTPIDNAPLHKAQIRWPVLIGSGALIVGIGLWAILAPDQAAQVIGSAVVWASETFGWYFILTAGIVVTFVLYLAFSAHGRTKLGPDHAKPQYNMFTWAAMLFAAGIGVDLMFFSVAEPVVQYVNPPTGAGETVEAARQAIVWTLFHYGPVGWAMYALMGGAFAYFAYRRNLPLNIRSLLTPLFGKRMDGWGGHTFDILAILGTVFGLATTLGIGVVQLSYGMHLLFGTPEGVAAQISLIVLAVAIATISTVSGVDKGIRRLSEANVVLGLILLAWIVITGETRRLVDGIVMNIGDFVSSFPSMLLDTMAWDRPDAWMQAWTLFFWAWWVAWAPFVGLFLARISRGRTLRQFIVGVLVIPFTFIMIFISILGNSALELVVGGDAAFAETAISAPERAFFDLLQQYPAAPAVLALALITGMLFYVTSADSGAYVLSSLSSKIDDPRQEPAKGLRVFWSLATGLLTLAMLLVGGVPTLQAANVVIGLPVSILLYLVMMGLFRALKTESQQQEGYIASIPGRFGQTARGWRDRVRRSTKHASAAEVGAYISETAEPALREVLAEIRDTGIAGELERAESQVPGVDSLLFTALFGERESFSYQIHPVLHELPDYVAGGENGERHYYRLEVFTASGSHGYDVFDYSTEQLIGDVLGHLESHIEYLRISEGGKDSSVGADDAIVTDWTSDFEVIELPEETPEHRAAATPGTDAPRTETE